MPTPVVPKTPKCALSLAVTAIVLSQSVLAVEVNEKMTVIGQHLNADTVIGQEALDNYQASDLEDIFKRTPEVNVGGGFGHAQKIYLRGFEDQKLNVTIDGATQAGSLFHHQGRLSVEPELLKQVEVQAGAGLATDGPGALGGAIRFVTKDPEDLLRDGENFGGSVKTGYFSNTDGLKLSANLFGRLSDKVSILTSLTRQDGDEIVDGNGDEQANTKSEINSGLFKIVGTVSDDQTLRFSYDFRNDDGTRNLRSEFIAAGWNRADHQESHRKTANLQYNLNPESSDVDLQANLYYTKTEATYDLYDDGAGVKSLGLDLRNSQQLSNNNLTYGINYRRDTGYYINPDLDEVARVAGVFLQDQIELTRQLTLNAGVRYDHYDLRDDVGAKINSNGFSPNLGFSYAVNDALTFRGGYARALRGAGVKEAYVIGYGEYDPEIKPEKADNLEFGFDVNRDSLSAGVTAYTGKIRNAIGRTSNVGDLKTKGVSAYLGYTWDNTDLHLAYSHNRPELDGEPLYDYNYGLGTSTGDTLTASVNHMVPERNLELGWSAELVKRLSDVPEGEFNKPGYGVHDVYARWYPQGNDDLSVTLTVKNLFDKQYLSHATVAVDPSDGITYGLAEPGRDVRLTVSARF